MYRVENIVAKCEIACNAKMLYVIIIYHLYAVEASKMHLEVEKLHWPFPAYDNSAADDFEHILQKIENLYNWMNNLWLKLENIVAKGAIASFEQFLLMSLCF